VASATAGSLVGGAWLAVARAPLAHVRAARLLPRSSRPGAGPAHVGRADGAKGPWSTSAVTSVCVLAGMVIALVRGGVSGLLVGALAAAALLRWLRRLEPGAARRRRLRLVADLPWAADLLAAAVEGGAPLDGSVRAVAEAVGGPLGVELRSVAAALALGAPPELAWWGAEASLHPVGRSFVRAAEHGTPPAEHIARLAEDLRTRAQVESAAALRAAGVHALAPLGACFLPAFLLLAVLPMVAGVASQLLG
jgi:Flp pilus assembly protein TadB